MGNTSGTRGKRVAAPDVFHAEVLRTQVVGGPLLEVCTHAAGVGGHVEAGPTVLFPEREGAARPERRGGPPDARRSAKKAPLVLQSSDQADREGSRLSHSRSPKFPEWYRNAPDGRVSGVFHHGAAPTGPRPRSPEATV